LDPGKFVKESNEDNNESLPADFNWDDQPKIKPKTSSHVAAPSFAITTVESTSSTTQPKQTRYHLTVHNWDTYDNAWFHPLKDKPSVPCGSGQTTSRMLVRFSVIRNGQALNAGCAPLESIKALQNPSFLSAAPLTDTDRVRIALEDRQNEIRYNSEPYTVGWFGLAKTLVPAGCKYFLGRAGSYLCTNDQGMAACENLRQQGKPIECRRTGK
jgi:hypothetical protein